MRRALVGLWLGLSCSCNGAGGAPAVSETTAPSAAQAENAPARPSGTPQPRLALGKIVLQTPPRAPVELTVEVADTDSARQRGLMFREQLGDDEGMLFVFPHAAPQSFWMRNTLIPLDMFFIDAEWRVVGVVQNAEPLTDAPRRVDGASQYVLEVNGGFAKRHGFGAGTEVRYTPPEELREEN